MPLGPWGVISFVAFLKTSQRKGKITNLVLRFFSQFALQQLWLCPQGCCFGFYKGTEKQRFGIWIESSLSRQVRECFNRSQLLLGRCGSCKPGCRQTLGKFSGYRFGSSRQPQSLSLLMGQLMKIPKARKQWVVYLLILRSPKI